MADKRKPTYVFLLRKASKRGAHKIEVFPALLWGETAKKYRIRVNGKWFPVKEKRFFGKYEIRDLVWRSIKSQF